MSELHLLRPLWLLLIPVTVGLWWLARRREAQQQNIGNLVAPHLREALTVNRQHRARIRPVDLSMAVAILLALGASGPTWSLQPTPWLNEQAPVVIALEVSDSMRSNDLLPSRLERARFKILDLVAARSGARTAIVAYAGSAHIVLPPSDDPEVIRPLLESLDPAIMPSQGSNTAAVLPLARQLLGEDSAGATLLFVNDGFEPVDIAPLADYAAQENAPKIAAWVMGTDAGGVALMPDGAPVTSPSGGPLQTGINVDALRRAESEAGVEVVRASPGDDDVIRMQRRIQSNLQQVGDADARWLDQGWLLVWPALLLTLLSFRRGWSLQW